MLFDYQKHEEHSRLFLKEIAIELGSPKDSGHASRVLTAVLHALRDHITVTESLHLIAQLPLYIKAVYVDCWKSSTHSKSKSLEDFLLEVKKKSDRTAMKDFKNPEVTKEEVEAVFRVIKRHVSAGEIEDIKSQLPIKIAELLEH